MTVSAEEFEKTKRKFNVSLTRSIRNLCEKQLARAYSTTNPWKAWRSLKIASVEVGKLLPRMDPAQARGWKHGDFGLQEITDPNDRDLGWQTVQAIGLTEKGKQVALTLTSSNSAKLTITS